MTEPNLHGCLRGEPLAQKGFFEHFRRKMFAFCLRFARSREDAEDILQDGFVRVFRDLPGYSGIGNLEGWVRKVMLNTALEHLRQQKRLVFTTGLDGHDLPDESPQHLDDAPPARQMLAILQQLPDGFRTVFSLHVLEGYSHPEIADLLGISVGTSKSQLLRAKTHFRKLLEHSLIS